jgi:protein transport protein SEC24
MPPPLPLTSERLERHGLFLIEDGQTLFLWVGRDAVPQLIIDVFDLPNYETLRGGKVFFPTTQYWRTVKLTRVDPRPHFHSSTIRSRSV